MPMHRLTACGSCSGNLIGDQGACSIATALRECTSVTEVTLAGQCITSQGALALAEALAGDLSDPAAATATSTVRDPSCCPSHRAFGHHHPASMAPPDYDEVMRLALGSRRRPEEYLTIHRHFAGKVTPMTCGAERQAEPTFAASCRPTRNLSVRSLALPHNMLGDMGALQLAAALLRGAVVEHLDLSDNGISCVGLQALAIALQRGAQLKSLQLDCACRACWAFLCSLFPFPGPCKSAHASGRLY